MDDKKTSLVVATNEQELEQQNWNTKGKRGYWKIVVALQRWETQTQNPNMGVLLTTLRLNKNILPIVVDFVIFLVKFWANGV